MLVGGHHLTVFSAAIPKSSASTCAATADGSTPPPDPPYARLPTRGERRILNRVLLTHITINAKKNSTYTPDETTVGVLTQSASMFQRKLRQN